MIFRDIYSTSLSKKELKKLDCLYFKKYSISTQNNMYLYSYDGNILNKAFRNYNSKWNKDLEIEFDLNEKQFIQLYINLDKA